MIFFHCINNDFSVRIYDMRVSSPVLTFKSHHSEVTQIQMDDWKCVSGSTEGSLCVWDQRNTVKLWDFHNRYGGAFRCG